MNKVFFLLFFLFLCTETGQTPSPMENGSILSSETLSSATAHSLPENATDTPPSVEPSTTMSDATGETPGFPTYSSSTVTNVNRSTVFMSSPPDEKPRSTAYIDPTKNEGSTVMDPTDFPAGQTPGSMENGSISGTHVTATPAPTKTTSKEMTSPSAEASTPLTDVSHRTALTSLSGEANTPTSSGSSSIQSSTSLSNVTVEVLSPSTLLRTTQSFTTFSMPVNNGTVGSAFTSSPSDLTQSPHSQADTTTNNSPETTPSTSTLSSETLSSATAHSLPENATDTAPDITSKPISASTHSTEAQVSATMPSPTGNDVTVSTSLSGTPSGQSYTSSSYISIPFSNVTTEAAFPMSSSATTSNSASSHRPSVEPSTTMSDATGETPGFPTYSSSTVTNVNRSTVFMSSPPDETPRSTAYTEPTKNEGSTVMDPTDFPAGQTPGPMENGSTSGTHVTATPAPTKTTFTTFSMPVNNGTVASAFTSSPSGLTQSPPSQADTTTNGVAVSSSGTHVTATPAPTKTPFEDTLSLSTEASSPFTSKITIAESSSSTSTTKTTTAKITVAESTSSASTTKTTTAKSTIRTTTSEICYNGGTYDGVKCLCNEDLFYGPKCEFPLDEIPVNELSVTITVEAQVRITNKEYKKSLEDLSSDYSQEIQAQFKKQMKVIYGAVPGYRDVEILRMRNGSIIVEHKVISQIQIKNNEETIQQNLKDVIGAVNHSLTDIHTDGECAKDAGPKLCFVPLPNATLIPSFSLKGTCKNITDPKYADYYYPYTIEGTVRCISRCFSGTQDSMNCYNGVCRLSEIGPHCICNKLDMFWYLDSYCQLPVQKTALGFGLALAVLFVVIIVLTVFLIRAKRKKSKNSWSADADTWYGEDADEEWIPSGSLNIMNKTAVSSWDKHQDRKNIVNLSLHPINTSLQKPTEFYRGTYPESSS